MLPITRKRLTHSVLMFLLLLFLPAGPAVADSIWTGATGNLWSDASNWSGGVPVDGDTVYFDIGLSDANYDNNNNDVSGLTNLSLQLTKGNVNISGNAIGLGSAGISVNGPAGATFNIDLSQPGDTTYSVGSMRTLTVNGVVSGAGGLVKTGGGRLVLTGANTYTGGTRFNAGTVSVGADGNLGDTAGGLTFNGGTLETTGDIITYRSVAVEAGGGTLDTDGNNLYSWGAMTGTGSLTVRGGGQLSLGNTAGSFDGDLIVNNSTLRMTTDNSLGTTAGNLTLNGSTLRFGNAVTTAEAIVLGAAGGTIDAFAIHTHTFAGNISGAGALAKTGDGTVILTGTNTYQGGTTVTAGVLQGNAASLQGDIANNAAVVFDQSANGTYAGVMSGTGSLTKTGSGGLTLTGANTYTGGTTVSAGTLQGRTTSLQGNILNNGAVIFQQATAGTYAGTMSGTGSLTQIGGSVTLSGANTYTGGTTISSGYMIGTTTSLQGDIVVNGNLTFEQDFDGTFSGNISGTASSVPLTGGVVKRGTGTVILSGVNTYNGGTQVYSGALQGNTASLQGDIALMSNTTVIFDQGTDGTYAGDMSGWGRLTKTGAGTLTLTGANTYTSTTVSAGTLQGNTGSLQGNIANNAAVVFDQAADGTYAGIMSGTGSLTKSGTGALTLSGANTYSGGTTVNAGTLQGTTASLQGDIANNAAVVFDQNTNGTYAGVMSGTGSLTKSGSGRLTLGGANTYTGGTAVSAGTLQGSAASLQGNIANNAVVVFEQGAAGTYTGNMSGTGSLTKTGAGILTLTGTGSYTGGTTVSAGTLQGNTASLQGNIANAAALIFDQTAAGTHAGAISGTGSLRKTGAGTLTLAGTNTYSGGTTVSAGALQGNTASLQGNIANAAALIFDQTTAGTYAGVISGTGSFAKTGAGTLNLTGVNTYSGLTTVNAGILAVNGSLAGPVAVGAAGTLGGNGTVGSVTVNGSLAPGNSIGTINTGSLTFNAGSVYTVEVDAAGNSDRTSVTGTVSLGSATLSVLAQNGTYGYQTNYLIIANDGGEAVAGTFGTINSNLAFLDPTVAYSGGDGNDVVLRLSRNDVTYSAVATTPNEIAVAEALEQMVAGGGGDAQIIMNSLTGLSGPQACRAYNEMSGAGFAAFFDTGIAGMTEYMKTMTRRMGALRAGGGSGSPAFSAGPVYLAAADTGTVSDADPFLFALGNASPLTPDRNWGVWGRGSGLWSSRNGDDIVSQYNYSLGGFTLGMDGRISDEFIVGLSAGYTHTNLDFDQLADTGKSDSYQAAVYTDYTAGPWYVDTILSYAANGYKTARTMTVGNITRTAAGDFNGREAAAFIEGGYVLLHDKFYIRPLASLQLTHVVLDGYTETGAGALNLAVGKRSVDSYLGSVGLRVSRPIKKSEDLLLSPEARLRWAHEFSSDGRVVGASFAGAPGSSFVVAGDEPVKDSAILGLGLNALYKKDFSFYLNYDVSASRDHTDHALVGGLRYVWD